MNGVTQLADEIRKQIAATEASGFPCIHSGPRHKLYRAHTLLGDIILKTPAKRSVAADRLLQELATLTTLQAPGVVKLLGSTDFGASQALLLVDAGHSNLARLLRKGGMSIADFLHVAIQLAKTISGVHRAAVIHGAIQPGNVVWDRHSRCATLCDFAAALEVASTSIRPPQDRAAPSSLIYVSPEQTGRTGRSLDTRSDLYSLGVTFYEMLAGRPPFTAKDPVELAHAHIARRPDAPHDHRSDIPRALSAIVSKLLEKEPEQRYQTAEALTFDLEEAQRQLAQTGTLESFSLAIRDIPRELSIPNRLYGRDKDIKVIEAVASRARRGGRELILITGAPGIGKSALINHLARNLVAGNGIFITGKFDQLQRSVPFSGIAQAFQALARILLSEPAAALKQWRERIEQAVAPNGQLLLKIVPELGRILGSQPELGEVGPVETKNRFHLAMTQFLSAVARREHPLSLFLDDIQWMDAASLELLTLWIGDTSLHHLLLLSAYRDTEVGPAHPLAISLADWRKSSNNIHELHLGPLGLSDITELATEAFKSDTAKIRALAALVLRRTAGNPFFARRLLMLLHAQGLIRYSTGDGSWQWDMTELESAPIADNVIDVMMAAIDRMPPLTQRLLTIGACIGHRFGLGTLCEAAGLSYGDAMDALRPALEDGLLTRLRESGTGSTLDGPPSAGLDASLEYVQFAHDRVQQAAYAKQTDDLKRALHLDIGRRLLRNADPRMLDQQLFDIVDQLNSGASLIEDAAERLHLAKLNLAAAQKAQVAAAYQAAFEYLNAAVSLLPPNAWNEEPALSFALHRNLAECAYLTGQHAMAEQLIEEALEQASSKVDRAELYSLRVLAATVIGDWSGALRWGREGLAVFGLEWPLEGLADANDAEASAVMPNVGTRRIESLLDEPAVQDADIRANMRLLSLLGPPAYFSGAEVLTFLVTRAVNLSLRHGPSPYSAFAYVLYGAIHNVRTGEYDIGYAFGSLALALARRFADRAEESRVLEVFGLVVQVWKAPLRQSLPLLREGYRAGIESGELAYAAFNLNSVLICGLPAGVPLADLLADSQIALDFARKHANRTSEEIALPFRQVARYLSGTTRSLSSFDDEEFEEATFLKEAHANGTALGNFWVARLQGAYLTGDYDAAARGSREGAKHLAAGILGMMPCAEHVFYTALMHAAVATEATRELRQALLPEISSLQRQLLTWATHCPENFKHKATLVAAEMARIAGLPSEAGRLYRAAIDEAAQQHFVQDEALAHELRARFLTSEHEPEFASVHFRAARDRYLQWGATVKARAIEIERPECFAAELRSTDRRFSIDTLALIKASQAISAETAPAAVFERILRVAVEAAGATRGAVVVRHADELTVRARIETQGEGLFLLQNTLLEESLDLPAKVIRYVARSKEPLLLADASKAEAFATDSAVRERQLRSVLCVPFQQHLGLHGVLYLENDALVGAFAEGLIEVVNILASQGVISLENALLHEASRQEIIERKQVERALSEANQSKDQLLARVSESDGRLQRALSAGRGIGTWDWNVRNDNLVADERFAHLYGMDPERARSGAPMSEYLKAIHPDDVVDVRQLIDRSLSTGALLSAEYRLLRGGHTRWVMTEGKCEFAADGAPVRFPGVSFDITDRKSAELRLNELNLNLERQVIERSQERGKTWQVSPHLLGALNSQGYFKTSNPAWKTVLGWTEEEVASMSIFDLLHPEDVERTRAGFNLTQIGQHAIDFPNRYRCKDGSYRWISWVGVFEDGLVYCSGRDITAEVEKQAALERAEEALRQAQKMEAVGQLTGGLAHDFNNLLGGISGSLELAQTRIAQGRADSIDRYLSAARVSVKRAASLTQRLLAFSRRQTLDPKPTDVNRLIAGMQELLTRTVGPAVHLECVGAGGLWSTLVDPNQLENALLNLCINARDAMPDGGRLTIETANKWLDERGAAERDLPPGQYVSLCVTDTGVGMAPDLVSKVFDPFFTTKPLGEGTGLGLSMVYGFARQSGGQVRVYSELGVGTTMCIYLPRDDREPIADANNESDPPVQHLSEATVVLVIDDEPTIRMLVVDVLQEAGYVTLEASDGPSGMRILQSPQRIDLLITDVGLPGGMNGRQVADAARASRPNLKILFITGYAENAAVGNGHLDKGMAVLTKPFVMEQLARKVFDIVKS